jgi:protein O-mannosyl-transferase
LTRAAKAPRRTNAASTKAPRDERGVWSRKHLWFVCAIAALTFAAFAPALRASFVSWDDEKNFLSNPHYRGLSLEHLRWMWTTFHLGHYVPLSWMTLGADYELWGMDARGYHLTNLLLHALGAVVVYFLARRLLGMAFRDTAASQAIDFGAFVSALVFAVHPLRVESVAWVTERRDVLSGVFFFGSTLLYVRSCDESLASTRRRDYWLAVALFSCALLSKATAMTLPAVLALLSVYPLRRLGGSTGWRSARARRVYAELVPFALLAGGAALLSIVALHPPAQLDAVQKIAVSAYGLAFYLGKTLLPIRLSPLYSMPLRVDPGDARFVVGYMLVLGLAAAMWWARRRFPGIVAALLAFIVVTLPMLGIVQNGPQIAADRYTYHAAPALAIIAGGAIVDLW